MPYIRQNIKNIKYPSLMADCVIDTIVENNIQFPPVLPAKQVTCFEVNGDYDSIVLSHTQLRRMTKMPWVICEEVANYIVTYTDGTQDKIPVTNGGNIGYWNRRQNEPHKHQLYRHNGYTTVYYTDGELHKTAEGENVTFYNYEFIIPENKKVAKIELVESEEYKTEVFLSRAVGVKSGK